MMCQVQYFEQQYTYTIIQVVMTKQQNITTARLLPNNVNTNNEYTLVTVLKYLVRCSVIPEEGISLLYTASGSPSWGPPIFFIFT